MSSSALAGKLRKRFTPDEYLIVERGALEKSEYYDGEIFAMSGAQEPHNIIAMSIAAMAVPLFRKSGCQPYGSDMKVAVTQQGPFFYPDLSVVCGERKFLRGRRDVLMNPALIVEILSRSTQRFDRGIKLGEYQRIPSVQAVLLISTDRASVDVHVRAGPRWKQQTITGLDKFIELPSPQCVLPLAGIYEGVDLRPHPKPIR